MPADAPPEPLAESPSRALPRPRTWGLRFSKADALVLAAGGLAGWGCWGVSPDFAALLLATVGHFFLFCNVFRVRRGPELIWMGAFLLNAAAWEHLGGGLSGAKALACQTPLTLGLLVREALHPRYHGIFARRINPRLDGYLAGKIP